MSVWSEEVYYNELRVAIGDSDTNHLDKVNEYARVD